MTAAYIALLLGAVSASWISRINLRGIFWLFISQIIFWLSVLYFDLLIPLPFLVVATLDAIAVGLIFKYGKEKWEEWIMLIFTSSIFVGFAAQLLNVFNISFNIYMYSWIMYVLNWSIIFIVGTISGLKVLNYDRNSLALSNWSSFLGYARIMDTKKGYF